MTSTTLSGAFQRSHTAAPHIWKNRRSVEAMPFHFTGASPVAIKAPIWARPRRDLQNQIPAGLLRIEIKAAIFLPVSAEDPLLWQDCANPVRRPKWRKRRPAVTRVQPGLVVFDRGDRPALIFDAHVDVDQVGKEARHCFQNARSRVCGPECLSGRLVARPCPAEWR